MLYDELARRLGNNFLYVNCGKIKCVVGDEGVFVVLVKVKWSENF